MDDRLAKMKEWEDKCIKEHGWYVHVVPSNTEPFLNVHTHGLEKSFKHKDLQIVLPMDPKISHGVISSAIDLIKEGTVFKEGERYSEVITNFDVTCINTQEADREVIRIILPDPQGCLGVWEMKDPIYKGQYFD